MAFTSLFWSLPVRSVSRACVHVPRCIRATPKLVSASMPSQSQSQSRLLHGTSVRSSEINSKSRSTRGDGSEERKTFKERKTLKSDRYLPLSPEGQRLRHLFSSRAADPVDTLLRHIEDGTANLELVRICLPAAKEDRSYKPRSDRPEVTAKLLSKYPKGLAAPVLDWLWTNPQRWLPLVAYDAHAIDAICLFAIAERLEGIIIDWTKAEVPVTLQRSILEGWDPEQWRTILTGRLYDMSTVYNGTTDRHIQRLLALHDWQQSILDAQATASPEARDHFVHRWSLHLLRVRAYQALTSRQYPHTDVDSFERFRNLYIATKAGERQMRSLGSFNIAILSMVHPDSPDAGLLLESMRERECKHGNILHEMSEKVSGLLQRNMPNAYDLLRKQNRHEDAQWLAKQHQVLFNSEMDRRPVKTYRYNSGTARTAHEKAI